MSGPLSGLRVVELGGIGPAPFAAMTLADLGADVIRIMRPGEEAEARADVMNRGKRGVEFDLKSAEGRAGVLELVADSDVLVEGFRPGVAERLSLGPAECLEANPRLVYGRISGWGADGPLSSVAGHDLNFIALTGALDQIGEKGGPPVPPIAFVGDFGGGAMSLAVGVLAAVWESVRSGRGQVVHASILDGAAHLTTPIRNFVARGEWIPERGSNLLDGGAPFYGVYETADHRHISIGPLERPFFVHLLSLLELDAGFVTALDDRQQWTSTRVAMEEVFATKTRDEWDAILGGTDVCYAPVLTMIEAESHPHNVAHGTFVTVNGVVQPAPTPRFDRTPASTPEAMRIEPAPTPWASAPSVQERR